jgi:catechol 2,3-dioxygenase-like lactoylglutathione lyase family enzyme
MKPRINFLTLGVDDLERSLAFYRDGLGLKTEGITGKEYQDGAIVFFKMNGDLTLALYPIASFVKDAKVAAPKARPGAVSLGHNVKSKAEVDAVIRQAEQAGAVVTDPPHDRFWGGYSGYFHDPDGHLWEIAWHPHSNLADE